MKRTLADFARACGGLLHGADATYSDVVSDSRTLAPQQLFVALKGTSFDGQRFERMLTPASLLAVGAGFGIGELAHKIYEVGEAAETAQRSLEGAWLVSRRFATGASDDFEMIKRKATDAYSQIEQMAERGVAPTQTYANVFNSIALPALERTRATTAQIAQLTEGMVPILATVSGGYEGAQAAAQQLSHALAGVGMRPPRELLKTFRTVYDLLTIF